MIFHKLIEGDRFKDHRGKLHYCNAFDMSEIVRFYEIKPASTSIIRAWQAHKQEKKWFYCNSGAFIVNLIKLDNFEKPSTKIIPIRFELSAEKPSVLAISGGYATGFKAKQEHSSLMIYSNFNVDKSKADDFRYDSNTWQASW